MDDVLTIELCETYFKKHLDEPVGETHSCPLQVALIEGGVEGAQVGMYTWHVGGLGDVLTLPPWAKKFISLVDAENIKRNTRGDTSIGWGTLGWEVIDGKTALELLAKAKEETEWTPNPA